MSVVSIVPCRDYTPETVRPALEAALRPLGGLDWVQPGMTVVIKANLVSMMKPESAALCSRPVVDRRACVGCEKCKNLCPAKAITMRNRRPVIDRTRCIRCFCCQELCPYHAIKVKKKLTARVIEKI